MNKMKEIGMGMIQVAILFFVSIALNKVAELLHLPIPGSILGIALLFTLLKTGVVKLKWIERGANWLLAELLLFFVPSAVGVMQYIPLLESEGVRILIVVILSTVIVMACSGLIASRIEKRKEGRIS
ncbi:CidA/LrgA family holin-like protein [Paenibacillus timonensis]|jgi:holin-like protein|nr:MULTISPECIES: CidA/LrgA family holin-like protein [Paenibacillus]MCH1641906.1 CidA/LrgA family holin-like protein [Paenibacillus timonensis]MDU2241703.1 CidA/LrgA family holin-like protein [Paenibacillus sp.]GJM82264.1 holin-like protein CidA [Paenibacillus sp. HMSSN-139]